MPRRPPPTVPHFTGFADPRCRFFHRLATHQSRAWFAEHRREYDDGWVAPMRLLLDELRDRLDALYTRHALGPPKIFRLHRDVRFSKDKSPYKTHIGGYVPLHGATGPGHPVPVYVQLGTENFVGAGHYLMTPPQLAAYRSAVLDEDRGRELARVVAALAKAGFTLGARETLKTVPRGIDPAHPRADLLRRKSLAVGFPAVPTPLVGGRGLLDWIDRGCRRVAPLVEWLADLDG